MRLSAINRLGLMTFALVFVPGVALAQNSATEAYASASPPTNPFDTPTPTPIPLPGDSDVLGKALMFDPSSLSVTTPAKKLRVPSQTLQQSLDIKTTEKPDGASSMTVKQPLPYDAHVGADVGLASSAPDVYRPGRPLPGSRDERNGSGAAWASLGVVPNLASVDARVDPTKDEGKFGTTFKHAMPIGTNFSMTLQNSYSITEAYGTPQPGPSDIPLMALPPPTPGAPQVWGNEKAAKFDILPTGTTFGAKLASTSADPVTHNSLSAEQKLYGPLHVTTAVNDVGQPTASKSITAGFKLHW